MASWGSFLQPLDQGRNKVELGLQADMHNILGPPESAQMERYGTTQGQL
jgi:hypothetical protein